MNQGAWIGLAIGLALNLVGSIWIAKRTPPGAAALCGAVWGGCVTYACYELGRLYLAR